MPIGQTAHGMSTLFKLLPDKRKACLGNEIVRCSKIGAHTIGCRLGAGQDIVGRHRSIRSVRFVPFRQ